MASTYNNILREVVKEDDINFVRETLTSKPELINQLDFCLLFENLVSSEMVSLFFQICGNRVLEYYDVHKKSILVEAFRFRKQKEIIKEIVSFNKDTVNRMDQHGMLPLYFCVSFCPNVDLVGYLISNGAEVNKRCVLGSSPLHQAKSLRIVNILLEAGANVNAKDNRGRTPLAEALYKKRCKEIILQLIYFGADVNAADKKLRIPLHYAFLKDYEEDVIYEIFGKTANVNTLDSYGFTPLCLAFKNDNALDNNTRLYRKEFILDLINRGAEINFEVFSGVLQCSNYSELVKAFIDRGFDVRSVDCFGNGVLHCVNDERFVNLLVRNGANVNLKNINDITPLMKACRNFNTGIMLVKSLLRHGADPVDSLDFYLKVVRNALIVEDEIITELILYGASISLENEKFKRLFMQLFINTISVNDNGFLLNSSILRYVFLSNENNSLLERLRENYKICRVYKDELDEMKLVDIMPNVSVYDFCMKHYKSSRCRISTSESMLVRDDFINIKSLFPVFHSEIINKIKINMRIENRIKLLSQLFKLSIRSLINSNNPDDNGETQNVVNGGTPSDNIELSGDSLYHYVGRYLSDSELKCLTCAAIKE